MKFIFLVLLFASIVANGQNKDLDLTSVAIRNSELSQTGNDRFYYSSGISKLSACARLCCQIESDDITLGALNSLSTSTEIVLRNWFNQGEENKTRNYFEGIFSGSLSTSLGEATSRTNRVEFEGHTDRSEIYYDGSQIREFEFSEHVLLGKSGVSMPVTTLNFSAAYYPDLRIGPGNGGQKANWGIYKEEWLGSAGTAWARLQTHANDGGVSFELNAAGNSGIPSATGSFTINLGDDNPFIISSGINDARIGWGSIDSQFLRIEAAEIRTDAKMFISSSLSIGQGIASFGSDDQYQVYLSSSNNIPTGLLIENHSIDPSAAAGITLRQHNVSNWIGTISESNDSELYSGALLLTSSGRGGITLNANSFAEQDYTGTIRFGINSVEKIRIDQYSMMLGTQEENPSAILVMHSTTQGFTPTRLTEVEIYKIKNPMEGLTLYNKTRKKYWFFNGSEWEEMNSKTVIRKRTGTPL